MLLLKGGAGATEGRTIINTEKNSEIKKHILEYIRNRGY